MKSQFAKKCIFLGLIISTLAVSAKDLLSERADFKTKIIKKEKLTEALAIPPKDIFSLIQFKTKIGAMSAYLSQHELVPGKKRPAIIWLTGGFPGTLPGAYLWEDTDYENDQSARTYRHHGIVMMFPTLRGRAKGNPGHIESFYGEVEDVIAAAEHLRKLPYIDSKRIYLGGHSTGGTLALLVAASTELFAGVISLGPTEDHYGEENAPYQWTSKEKYLRSPVKFTSFMKVPTYIVEGESGNAGSLVAFQRQQKKQKNEKIVVAKVKEADHFSVIHPINRLFARAILKSKDGSLKIDAPKELETAYLDYQRRQREVEDLKILVGLRSGGLLIEGDKTIESSFYTWKKEELASLQKLAGVYQFISSSVETLKNDEGKVYYGVKLSKKVDVSSLGNVFKTSRILESIARKSEIFYDYWTIKK